LTVVKAPRNQEVLADPEGLPGVYLALLVAILEGYMSSSNVGGSPPFMVNIEKSPLVVSVFSPHDKFVASSNGSTSVPNRTAVSLMLVWVNACQNCQKVVCQFQSLVTGMTYRRRAVLFPLRMESVHINIRLKLIRRK